MNNEKIQPTKLDIILKKKQGLDATIQEYETRIDEKLATLADNENTSQEINANIFEMSTSDHSLPEDHFLSGVDISDDAALDQAVLNSRPFATGGNQLAFNGNTLIDEKDNIDSSAEPIFSEDIEDEELPTLSKILGRSPVAPNKIEDVPVEELKTIENTIIPYPELIQEDSPSEIVPEPLPEIPTFTEDIATEPIFPEPLAEKVNPVKPKQTSPRKSNKPSHSKEILDEQKKTQASPKKLNLIDMVLPLILFITGLVAFGAFLILFSHDFSFVDYSILFILFTCLIFTIAMPFSASIFFMILLFCSYIVLTLISIFYLEVPLEMYQLGWIIVIPLILWSSALLIKRIRELFTAKRALEGQIASYDILDEGPGLTIEKAYYKDLKSAMDRAVVGETILVLEMISISHLETLRSITGPRLWDEILYKTLNIIKKHCFSTHLIYVLEGNIFSIIMENTSMKNQLMINQGITEDFNAMISDYNAIDVHVGLDITPVPYSREITNPFEYRALGLRHLKK
ncbi:hypothetical protein [Acetobacterium bakii]|uniref:GGDEF domain-containing protein n=1 Tax=Acetobacterium bakii TaxID=52689 RepID=A0A0L6U0T0_9FIRM|nr:hypothetical protein [Acetobacterium bakii]KNZ41942.1 hypothetical protein AKG39_10050 [Acetobacterium bakii]